MERRINRRQQGDLGEASAIEWLTQAGYKVLFPLFHSPDYDLVAEDRSRKFLRVQVKTSCRFERGRWVVAVCTKGGNQSWSGVVKAR
jgi:Holliday junction resolvase-like predicted endonuclease